MDPIIKALYNTYSGKYSGSDRVKFMSLDEYY